MPPRIYLDNAATSWPKPDCVYSAVDHYLRQIGAAAGRGAYAEAVESGRLVEQARRAAARVLGATEADSISFGLNGTDALNTVIHGWVRPGDHVVTTQAEHNSVLRPLAQLQRHAGVSVTTVPCDAGGRVDPADVERALRPQTRLVAVTHASNVTGAIQPVVEIIALAHRRAVAVLVDAAQTAGYVPIDVAGWDVDFLAAPGHKGLLGPLGTAVLYVHPRHASQLRSFRQGGTGTRSNEVLQPDDLPGKFEAGNLNVAGIAGLGAALNWRSQQNEQSARDRAQTQTAQLRQWLQRVPGVRVLGPVDPLDQVAVVSLTLGDHDVHELAAMLDAAYRIQVRAGLHCAPVIHQALGTPAGTLRVSPGHFTTAEELERLIDALSELAAGLS